MEALRRALGHRFRDEGWLIQALTHPSVGAPGGRSGGRSGRTGRRSKPARRSGAGSETATLAFQRLEFLGDRVLSVVIADMLFDAFPQEPEGALAKRHTALVRQESLAEVARRVGLAGALALGRGEVTTGGRGNPAILADACEAVIAALYKDGGLPAARAFIEAYWGPLLAAPPQPPQDPKTALQEWAQGRGLPLPRYETLRAEGPAHAPEFEVAVSIEGHPPGHATGASKRAAEREAAAALLTRLTSTQGHDGT